MRSARAWPLKLKLALCSALVFIVGAGSVAWYVVRELREDFESLITRELVANAGFVARHLDGELNLRLGALATMAPIVSQLMRDNPLRMQAYLLDRKVTLRMISGNLFVISKESVRIAEAPDHGHVGSDYAGTPYVQAVLATGKPVILAQFGRHSGRPSVLIAVPLLDDQGKVIGVLCGSDVVARGSSLHLAGEIPKGGTGGYHVLAPSDGVIVTSTDDTR